MMPALNRIPLIGYLGRDPETRFTPTGKKVTHFSVAISQRWKVSGETRDYTEWVNAEAWGRIGEVCQEYLKKGSLNYPEGRLKTDKYGDQNGDSRYFNKVIALGLQFLDKTDKDEAVLNIEEEAQITKHSSLRVDSIQLNKRRNLKSIWMRITPLRFGSIPVYEQIHSGAMLFSTAVVQMEKI